MRIEYKHTGMLLITAMIWGGAFVAQAEGGALTGPMSFNCIRNLIAFIVIAPVIKLLDKCGLTKNQPVTREDWLLLLKAGIAGGFFLAAATLVQQVGLYLGATVGKAGFLTACYIIIVPIMGRIIGRFCSVFVWVAAIIALGGLYLLCIKEGSFDGIVLSDGLMLLCAALFSVQILIVDKYVGKIDGVRMSWIQVAVSFVLSFIPMLFWEMELTPEGIIQWLAPFSEMKLWVSLIYTAVLSSGVAYTFQIIGQQGVNPSVASLVMSLESVFAVLSGWLFLNEQLTVREIFGCITMFIAIIIAQLPLRK